MPTGRETILTKANMRFIRKNRLKMCGSDIAEQLGVGKGVITRYLRREGLQVPREMVHKWKAEKLLGRTSSSKKEDLYLIRNYLKLPVKTLAANLNRSHTFVITRLRQLSLEIPPEIILQRKIDSRIKPGTIPPNKGKRMSKEQYRKCMATMFKRGSIPPNTKVRDGIIVTRMDSKGHPYRYIRVSIGKWVQYHRYRWEMFRGTIPAGHCLWFKDGNSLNTKLENLELITRAENMRRNSIARFPPELRSAIFSLSKLNKKISSWEQETKSVTSRITSSPKSKGSVKKTSRGRNLKAK